ncbi:carbohydrate ABC transporter permease [Paenibacillus sp. LHD-117]|uniref:carbohydrate ABC transporter permease n=1 Tax=Paenibacillus sp. LHD-117 TaxID=3071412 RepID=UPI0027DF08BC|nr:carbohydrate ABC transporter permease [Paenibacillus sp. LHD-117]MDQ6421453.1 carbohydrate ABC transporter permease [Paenibacillus sp. LHD-117]
MKKLSSKQKSILTAAAAFLICMVFLYPLYWLIVTSLKTEVDIFKSPPSLFPETVSFNAYLSQLKSGEYNMLNAFYNSAIISVSAMVLSTVLSIPAAYGLARFRFKGKKLFILSFLVTQMLPSTLVLTPLFIMFNNLQIINTYVAPILADSTIGIPFAILILRTYFLSIPKELEEAAKMDGCNHFTAFIRIMIPIAYPGVVVAAVFSLLYAWGDLIYGLTFINKSSMRPITAGIYNFMQQYGTSWNSVMAYGMITISPVVLIFIFMQKYIVSGLTNGAIKA